MSREKRGLTSKKGKITYKAQEYTPDYNWKPSSADQARGEREPKLQRARRRRGILPSRKT
jgi:hypothetical protein